MVTLLSVWLLVSQPAPCCRWQPIALRIDAPQGANFWLYLTAMDGGSSPMWIGREQITLTPGDWEVQTVMWLPEGTSRIEARIDNQIVTEDVQTWQPMQPRAYLPRIERSPPTVTVCLPGIGCLSA